MDGSTKHPECLSSRFEVNDLSYVMSLTENKLRLFKRL